MACRQPQGASTTSKDLSLIALRLVDPRPSRAISNLMKSNLVLESNNPLSESSRAWQARLPLPMGLELELVLFSVKPLERDRSSKYER